MKFQIPEAMRLREEAICDVLRHAAETGGETGEAAELLEVILLPHLARERVDILEPLGLLPLLAQGEVRPEMAGVLPQISQLKSDLHGLRVEHAAMLSAMKRFVAVARAEEKSAHARFAERLLFRAWLDESVFTPLAILIGKYLEQRLDRKAPPTPAASPAPLASMKLELPEALQLSHTQLSAALIKAARAGDRAKALADSIGKLLEPHLQHEEANVLRILGLLAPLAAGNFDPEWIEDVSLWGDLETNESTLDREHSALITAGEELLEIARNEGAGDVLDFAERLLLRIRLTKEVFYPAALLVRHYLKLNSPAGPSPKTRSVAKAEL